ncbi:hypothetical protein C8R46DRAFT_143203 [Mycena filopes]|nr:hypothetical protein C8R46DRAFT_143203 [Mycena filopes]
MVSLNMVGRRRDPKQVHRFSAPRSLSHTSVMQRSDSGGGTCNYRLDTPSPLDQGPCIVKLCDNDNNTECVCSNVAYILQAACVACSSNHGEPVEILSWSQYADPSFNRGCNGTTPSPLPTSLSDPTKIAPWVDLMISATPSPTTFVLDDAYQFAAEAKSGSTTPSPSQTSSRSVSTSSVTPTPTTGTASSGDTPASPSAPPAPPPNGPPLSGSSKHSSSAGAIAGGVIGALIVLALVGAGIWLMRRRRHAHTAPSAAYKAAVRAGNSSPMPYRPVRHEDSPKSSSEHLRLHSDDSIKLERPSSPWRPVSIRSESRFHEHTS